MNNEFNVNNFRYTSRLAHPENTVICVKGVRIGEGLTFIAGPCSVESKEQILQIAKEVKKAGAVLLRGGAFKPRTSPYSFQGLRDEGLKYLCEAGKETGLPTVSEITDLTQLSLFSDIDIIQVGARNMQNFELLRELGHSDKPILLKRGSACTVNELLMSAEYILSGGNKNVILCERGIRTFETSTRATLDISAVPVLKHLTHLPIIVDPSHAAGYSGYVTSLSLSAVAAGAHGLMIEVHNDPIHSISDSTQALTPDEFADTVLKAKKVRKAICE